MKQPLVSIIMPVYNAENFLSEAIDSVLQQTYPIWELVLVDDGSLDRSLQICEKYARHDQRIRVISTPNSGVSHARNVGLKAVQGEWIVFIDSDDLIKPDSLSQMLEYSNDVDVVACGFEFHPSGPFHSAVSFVTDYDNFSQTKVLYATANQHFFFYTVWGKLYRRTILIAEFDESIKHSEDEIFNLQNLPNARGIRVIPHILYKYRSNDDRSTLSNKLWYDVLELRVRIFHMLLDVFNKDPVVVESAINEMRMVILRYVFTIVNTRTINHHQKQAVLEIAVASSAVQQYKKLRPNPSDSLWKAIYNGNIAIVYWICKKRYLLKNIKDHIGINERK